MNASPFWIMLLLSSGANERRMIDGAWCSVGGPQSVGVALSRRKQGFESPRERQRFQRLSAKMELWPGRHLQLFSNRQNFAMVAVVVKATDDRLRRDPTYVPDRARDGSVQNLSHI
jgi:hypothetical protein